MQISLFRLFIAGVVEKDVSTTLNVTRGGYQNGLDSIQRVPV